MPFSQLGLAEPLLRAVTGEGYTTATPIQRQAIPHVLKGRDVLGCAQTGTGKTAAFSLPILHRLSATAAAGGAPTAQGTRGSTRVRCLVLCPTRELATQIAESFRAYGKHLAHRTAVIFGGVNQNPQVAQLRSGVEILVATPGRLLDLMNQGHADLRGVGVLVLDEADRMLDMGFIHDIRKIVAKLPSKRQTLLFSATMPPEIRTLANTILHDPVTVQVAPVSSTAEGIDESVYFVEKRNKPALLAHLVNELPMARALVFSRTKHGADRVVRQLHIRGIRAESIHGNKSQNARERALKNFRDGKTPVLVATDIASRGIDVEGISHVVNYDLTHEPETYIHRIGRTARAGATGVAVSFCDRDEVPNLRAVEKLVRRSIPVKTDQPKYEAPVADTRGDDRPRTQHRKPSHASHATHAPRSSHPTQVPRPHPTHRREGEPSTTASHPTPHSKFRKSGPNGLRPAQPHPAQPKPSHPRSGHSRPGQVRGSHPRTGRPGGGARPTRKW